MRKRFEKPQKYLAREISEGLGKMPPQAVDLEVTILGACMLERFAVQQVIDILHADDFYSETHRTIYGAILALYRKEWPVDMRTVVNQLREVGQLELVGGAYYVAEITSGVSSAANVEYHARVVIEMSMKRQLIMMSSQIQHDAYEDTTDIFEALDASQAQLDAITGKYVRNSAKPARQLYEESIQSIIKAQQQQGVVGIPTGYLALDRLVGGWLAPDLIIIAARPSMGKSALVGNITLNAALQFLIPVGIFSLEMAGKQFMDRMIACLSEVNLEHIIRGTVTDLEFTRIDHMSGKLSTAPIFIDDTPAITILELRAKARRMVFQDGVQIIIVDYLQLMRGESNGNREQEVSSISRALKSLAKELNIPVIALSQLSRGVETRGGDKRPQLSDLRESGSIEQDADIVMFLYRAEYYKITQYEDGTPTQGTMEVIVAKHRNGRCDTELLKFIGQYSKITDFDSLPRQLPIQTERSYKDRQAERQLRLEDEPPEQKPF